MNILKWFQKEEVSQRPIGQEMASWDSSLYAESQQKPYNPDLLAARKGGIKIYRDMMFDDQVKAVMQVKINSILSSGYKFETVGETPIEEEMKNYLEYAFSEGMDKNFKHSLTSMLSALIYGFSVSEKVFKIYNSGTYKGKIGLKALKIRPAQSFEFHTDKYNNLEKIVQEHAEGTKEFIGEDLKYFVIYSFHADNSDYENIYGVSDLRAAYRPWFSKDMNIRFLNIYSERFGIGIIHGKYAPGLSGQERKELENIINKVSSKTSFMTPDKVTIDILESKKASTAQFIEIISMYDKSIARALLVPNMLGLTDVVGGTYNLGEKHFDLYMAILGNIRDDITEMVNEQVVRDLIDKNYANVKDYPRFKFNPITEAEKEKMTELFLKAVNDGVILATEEDEAYTRESLNYPLRKDTSILMPKKAVPSPLGGMSEEDKEPSKEMPIDEVIEEEKEKDNKKFALNSRPLTRYEKKINFVKLENDLNDKQYKISLEVGKQITKMKDELISSIVRKKIIENKDFKEVNKIDLKYLGDLRLLWKDILRQSFIDGQKHARASIPKKFAKVPSIGNLPPKEALAYFESKAFWITGVERDRILTKAKTLLNDGIRSGLTTQQVVFNLEEVFLEYEVMQKVGTGALKPITEIKGRTEAIVRTNNMDAFNQGNLNQMQAIGKEIVPAYQFSAIMDSRTSDVCLEMDEKIFKADDPIWARYNPPLHFQCRSLLVPVLNDEAYEVSNIPSIKPDVGFGG